MRTVLLSRQRFRKNRMILFIFRCPSINWIEFDKKNPLSVNCTMAVVGPFVFGSGEELLSAHKKGTLHCCKVPRGRFGSEKSHATFPRTEHPVLVLCQYRVFSVCRQLPVISMSVLQTANRNNIYSIFRTAIGVVSGGRQNHLE